jgi:hypothetical protein
VTDLLSRFPVTSWLGSNYPEKKFHNPIETVSTALTKFAISPFMGLLSFGEGQHRLSSLQLGGSIYDIVMLERVSTNPPRMVSSRQFVGRKALKKAKAPRSGTAGRVPDTI